MFIIHKKLSKQHFSCFMGMLFVLVLVLGDYLVFAQEGVRLEQSAAENVLQPRGQLTYVLSDGWEKWPEDKRKRIVTAMDEAVALYNQYGRFQKKLRVAYVPSVRTADANYKGNIRFGKQIATRTALHEISHTLGIGTTQKWRKILKDKQWTGYYANRLLQSFDGADAKLKGDRQHFWPYGLNYAKGDSPVNRIRHVMMVEALCRDMDLPVFVQDGNRRN